MNPGQEDRLDIGDLQFAWHPVKAEANLRKHGVSFEEAKTVFGDRKLVDIPDREHSLDEERSIAIGRSEMGNLLIVSFADRDGGIRIISARATERWERRVYESANESARTGHET